MNETSSLTWIQTRDGSWTAFNTEAQEHYHNLAGAYAEAVLFYVQPSQLEKRFQSQSVVTLLDPFLGLGYNTLACIEAFCRMAPQLSDQAHLRVIAIEKDPVLVREFPGLLMEKDPNLMDRIWTPFAHNIYYRTHESPSEFDWKSPQDMGFRVSIQILPGDTRGVIPTIPVHEIDLIYHDPFSPKAHPELWTQTLFTHYARLLNPKSGIVITYSAAASVRTGLRQAGFHLYRLPVFKNKTGTIATTHPQNHYDSLLPLEEALMNSRSGLPFLDNDTLTLNRDEIIQNRQNQILTSTRPSSSAVHRQFRDKASLPQV